MHVCSTVCHREVCDGLRLQWFTMFIERWSRKMNCKQNHVCFILYDKMVNHAVLSKRRLMWNMWYIRTCTRAGIHKLFSHLCHLHTADHWANYPLLCSICHLLLRHLLRERAVCWGKLYWGSRYWRRSWDMVCVSSMGLGAYNLVGGGPDEWRRNYNAVWQMIQYCLRDTQEILWAPVENTDELYVESGKGLWKRWQLMFFVIASLLLSNVVQAWNSLCHYSKVAKSRGSEVRLSSFIFCLYH